MRKEWRTGLKSAPEEIEFDLRDSASVAAFYDAALPRIYSYFFNRCGGRAPVAEDLTQETFMAAVKELKQNRNVETPMAWVFGIARHKLLDHLRIKERERRRLEAVASSEEGEALVEWADDDDSRDKAVAALERVADPQRSALVLRYLDGMSVPEVARELRKTVRATESLIARGKQSFRRAYEEQADA